MCRAISLGLAPHVRLEALEPVSRWGPRALAGHGEEPILVGWRGGGKIFAPGLFFLCERTWSCVRVRFDVTWACWGKCLSTNPSAPLRPRRQSHKTLMINH